MFNLHNQRPLNKFPFSFGNLKLLFLRNGLILNAKTLNFIEGLHCLTALFILKVENLNGNIEALLQLRNIRSNIEELSIGEFNNIVPVDCIVRFLMEGKALKRLTVIMTSKNDDVVDQLKAKLSDKWKLIDRKFRRDHSKNWRLKRDFIDMTWIESKNE